MALKGPIQAQELSNYLASVSFLVIPSRIESIPVIFSDALQRGTPVVSTPVGDLAQLVGEPGCGIVAENLSPEALAGALKLAVAADGACYAASTASAYARFDIRKSVAQWLAGCSASPRSAKAL